MPPSTQTGISTDVMRVAGARTHNLKNIDVDIPRNSLVVITGKSGSGKSSLAIDTIFAEGQRQYIESLSLYARQFFDQAATTDVDHIEGLQPTVCINQNRGNANPRSTVGTITEVYDFLRLLMAKVGEIRCPECGQPVTPQTLEQICSSIKSLPENTKVMILAPIVRGRKGKHVDVIERVRKERLVRVRVDGELFDIDSVPVLSSSKNHDIEAVTDRIIVRDGIDVRLYESVEMASRLSDGLVAISFKSAEATQWQEQWFSTRFACSQCNTSVAEIEPRSFSFNSPYGACEKCGGLGHLDSFDTFRVIPNRKLSVEAGAVRIWENLTSNQQKRRQKDLVPVLKYLGISKSDPLSELSAGDWETFVHSEDKNRPGLLLVLEKELATCVDEDHLDQLEGFRGSVVCGQCRGTRLNKNANSVVINDNTISQICSLTLDKAAEFFDEIELDSSSRQIAEPILLEIRHRLDYLKQVGLEYLTLSRPSETLSGGELQRVRLASLIGSGLAGACYVLDEPSIGLHQRDTDQLIAAIRNLQHRGNSLLVVEHDESIIRAADHVVDVGPDAGKLGGEIVAQGSCAEIELNDHSLTGAFLKGKERIERAVRQLTIDMGSISIRGAGGFNLKNIDVDLPLGKLNCVTGVSGSGKSTLINGTLAPAIKEHLGLITEPPESYESITGLDQIERLVQVDQRPIGRTSRGCAATYSGIFADIRKLFASTRLAKQRGFSASRFSFNTKAGWCPACEGHGSRPISMKFMADIHVPCENCSGRRFNTATLGVRFRNKTIAEVLEMSVSEAIVEFSEVSNLRAKLQCLEDVGLGYLPLGQPSNTLSGGEAQRVKLATELSARNSGSSLYLLDEPTTGLHFDDVRMLLNVLAALVEKGNTVVVIEHNLDVIRCADWIIDLGPEAGMRGGDVVAVGTPEHVAKCADSLTGRVLATVI